MPDFARTALAMASREGKRGLRASGVGLRIVNSSERGSVPKCRACFRQRAIHHPEDRSCRRGFRGHSRCMAHTIELRLQAPGDLGKFRLPSGVQRRLNELLDRQDQGKTLTAAERREAEGLVEVSEMLSLLKLRAAGARAAAA